MLKETFEIYAIKTSKDGYHSSFDEFFDTFEEALDNSKNYSDWYRSEGNCTIVKLCFGASKTFTEDGYWKVTVDHDGKNRKVEFSRYEF